MYEVIDNFTGNVICKRKSLASASEKAKQFSIDYGSTRYGYRIVR